MLKGSHCLTSHGASPGLPVPGGREPLLITQITTWQPSQGSWGSICLEAMPFADFPRGFIWVTYRAPAFGKPFAHSYGCQVKYLSRAQQEHFWPSISETAHRTKGTNPHEAATATEFGGSGAWRPPVCPSPGKWLRKICWVLPMEQCAQGEALLHTTWA